MQLLKGFGQHVGSLTNHLNVLHHRIICALVSNQCIKLITLNEIRYISGILDDVLQPSSIPRSFSHKSIFYHD